MAETTTERAAAVEKVAQATANQGPGVQQTAMDVLNKPSPATTDRLWLILVAGLVGALLAAAIGLIVWAGHDKAQTDKIITVFSAVLAGLVGLFVKSPVQSAGGAGGQ